ncbi:hypothetical protein J6590_096667 [Homalodisca vitripennis]|nr:hypothetical protein J6590_096667 [Homalodisca vitripennis]
MGDSSNRANTHLANKPQMNILTSTHHNGSDHCLRGLAPAFPSTCSIFSLRAEKTSINERCWTEFEVGGERGGCNVWDVSNQNYPLSFSSGESCRKTLPFLCD